MYGSDDVHGYADAIGFMIIYLQARISGGEDGMTVEALQIFSSISFS